MDLKNGKRCDISVLLFYRKDCVCRILCVFSEGDHVPEDTYKASIRYSGGGTGCAGRTGEAETDGETGFSDSLADDMLKQTENVPAK